MEIPDRGHRHVEPAMRGDPHALACAGEHRRKMTNKNKKKKKKIVVAVSGGFDPIHIGHLHLFKEAKKIGSELVVILNNDNWLKKKKGYNFLPQKERKEILAALRYVDRVFLTKHQPNPKDMSVSRELRLLKPNVFANGGDRTLSNIPEVAVCREIDCRMVFNIGKGGKLQSSSWLLKNFLENHTGK